MPYLLYLIIIKRNNLLKEEVHCQGIKLHRKSSTVRKHLNSMTSLRNLNMKLIGKKSRRPQSGEVSRHKQTSFMKKNLVSVTSKRILKCMLVKMEQVYTQMKVTTNQLITWTHHLYFLKVIAVVVVTLIQMATKMIQKAQHLLFLGGL